LKSVVALPLLLLASGCAATVDHQAELLTHPCSWVQGPAIVGAVPGVLLGIPVWGVVALIDGADGVAAARTFHAFAYPGALALSVVPWWIAGPSYERIGPRTGATVPGSP